MRAFTRFYFLLGGVIILAIFYFSSGSRTPPLTPSGSAERQAVWADVEPEKPAEKQWRPRYADERPAQQRLDNVKINPYPLGDGPGDDTTGQAQGQGLPNNKAAAGANAKRPRPTVGFNEEVFDFQKDLPYGQPKMDVEKLLRYRPHHFVTRNRPTFATFYATRNSSMRDPYFLATQQLIYRTLWHPVSRTRRHPFTVFVAPFISQEQRESFAAAGAIVRQLDLVPWNPEVRAWARWRDLFSKINMWGQSDFSRIAFLDADAMPLKNLDDIFGLSPHEQCKKELLPEEDRSVASEICGYTFTGSPSGPNSKEINTGVMVFNPNKHMQARLLRMSKETETFDNNKADQAFFNMAFAADGPFPMSFIPHEWNGFLPQKNQEGKLKIVHEKLWAFGNNAPWTQSLFAETQRAMVDLYESKHFESMRIRDGMRTI